VELNQKGTAGVNHQLFLTLLCSKRGGSLILQRWGHGKDVMEKRKEKKKSGEGECIRPFHYETFACHNGRGSDG